MGQWGNGVKRQPQSPNLPKFLVKFFSKKLAVSKGSAFGRSPQRAKFLILLKRPKGVNLKSPSDFK
jgi:hypothetical protein